MMPACHAHVRKNKFFQHAKAFVSGFHVCRHLMKRAAYLPAECAGQLMVHDLLFCTAKLSKQVSVLCRGTVRMRL
jgi:hypothetical protein